MKSTISRLDEEVTYLENTKASLEMERDSISSKNDMNISSSQLADEREQFKKECSVLNSSVAELTQKLEHCENERSNLNQTIQEFKTMIVHLEKDKEFLSSQLEEKDKSQIALEESEKEKLNAMISEVQKVSLELEKKLEDSVQKCQAISSELKEEKISVSTFKEEYSLMKLAVSSIV
uniref:Uncharacterized protein n=1 Tax=Biomphalaria glabrata TaxID=6526 RepID=A0A2C9LYM2_BIOGL